MKLVEAYDLLGRRQRHLESRIAQSGGTDSAASRRSFRFDDLEAKALGTVLELVREAITDSGECICQNHGRCGHCRISTIPTLRAQILAAETCLQQHADLIDLVRRWQKASSDGDVNRELRALTLPEVPDITGLAELRLRISFHLAQMRGLPHDLEYRSGPGGPMFWWGGGTCSAQACADPALCEAIVWLSHNRRQIVKLLGRSAE